MFSKDLVIAAAEVAYGWASIEIAQVEDSVTITLDPLKHA